MLVSASHCLGKALYIYRCRLENFPMSRLPKSTFWACLPLCWRWLEVFAMLHCRACWMDYAAHQSIPCRGKPRKQGKVWKCPWFFFKVLCTNGEPLIFDRALLYSFDSSLQNKWLEICFNSFHPIFWVVFPKKPVPFLIFVLQVLHLYKFQSAKGMTTIIPPRWIWIWHPFFSRMYPHWENDKILMFFFSKQGFFVANCPPGAYFFGWCIAEWNSVLLQFWLFGWCVAEWNSVLLQVWLWLVHSWVK